MYPDFLARVERKNSLSNASKYIKVHKFDGKKPRFRGHHRFPKFDVHYCYPFVLRYHRLCLINKPWEWRRRTCDAVVITQTHTHIQTRTWIMWGRITQTQHNPPSSHTHTRIRNYWTLQLDYVYDYRFPLTQRCRAIFASGDVGVLPGGFPREAGDGAGTVCAGNWWIVASGVTGPNWSWCTAHLPNTLRGNVTEIEIVTRTRIVAPKCLYSEVENILTTKS